MPQTALSKPLGSAPCNCAVVEPPATPEVSLSQDALVIVEPRLFNAATPPVEAWPLMGLPPDSR